MMAEMMVAMMAMLLADIIIGLMIFAVIIIKIPELRVDEKVDLMVGW